MTSSKKDPTASSKVTPNLPEVLMDFGSAVRAMRKGCRVARLSWGNPGKYVFMQPGEEMFDPETGTPVIAKAHLMWKNDKGEFVAWTPSQDAVLAEDWFIGKSGQLSATSRPPAQVLVQTIQVTLKLREGLAVAPVEQSLLNVLVEAADDWYSDEGSRLLVEEVEFTSGESQCGCTGLSHRFECPYHVPAR